MYDDGAGDDGGVGGGYYYSYYFCCSFDNPLSYRDDTNAKNERNWCISAPTKTNAALPLLLSRNKFIFIQPPFLRILCYPPLCLFKSIALLFSC